MVLHRLGTLSLANTLRPSPKRWRVSTGGCVAFPFLCYCPFQSGSQEGRAGFAKIWPSALRKGGSSSCLLGYSTPSLTGSRAHGEMNPSSVLLLRGGRPMHKDALLHLNDHILPPLMSPVLCSFGRWSVQNHRIISYRCFLFWEGRGE